MRRVQSRSGLRRHLLSTLATGVLAAAAPPALAGPKAIALPAGPLERSLATLSAQTGDQLLFPPQMVAGRQAPALSGRMSTEEALRRLLPPEAFEARRTGPRIVVLKPRNPTTGSASPPAASAPGPAADDGPFGDGAGTPAPLPASPPRRPEPAAVQVLETVEVVGTRIRGTQALASPLLVIDQAELARSGHATVAGALAVLPQNFAGTSNEGAVTSNTDRTGANANYGTGLNLRGLGSDATLTLVNGRRMAGAGAKGDFADISTIPTIAVSRVEILLDGASALYGSDAVGGVVNIVLRRDVDGAETQALAGVATAGEPAEARLSQILGRTWTGGGAWMAYELHRRDALPSAARRFTASADLRPLGGADRRLYFARPGTVLRFDPTTGASVPGWAIPPGQDGIGLTPADFIPGVANLGNQRADLDVLPQQTRHAVYVAAHQRLSPGLELEAEARWGYRRYALRTGTPIALLTVTPRNPFFVPLGGAAFHQVAYGFGEDLAPTKPQGSAESLGLTVGATLDLPGDWQARAYGAFAQEIGEHRTFGTINATFLAEAVGTIADRPDTPFSPARDGYFNPYLALGAQPAAVLDVITQGFAVTRTRDRLASLNAQADGTLLQLPGGPLKLAVGGQLMRESFLRTGATFNSGVTPTRLATVDADRTMASAFAEARIPLVGDDLAQPGLRRLEVSLAGRVDRYDDVGRAATPKVGVLWSPAEGLQLRVTYGRSFRAPGLRETRDPELYSPSFLPLQGATLLSLVQTGGNPDLEPETARSWSLGFDWAPPGGPARFSATLFDTRFEDRIDQPARTSLGTALTDPALSRFVRRVSPTTSPADRMLIEALLASPFVQRAGGVFPAEAFGAIVDARYVNTASVHVRGLDLSGSYALDAAGGRLRLSGALSYLFDFEQRLTPTAPERELVGLANFPVRLRARLAADWTRGAWGLTGGLNYVDDYESPAGAPIDHQATLDLQARWAAPAASRLRGLTVTASVRNLFDRAPPFYDSEFGIGYDPANADPVGRFVSLQLTQRW